MYNERNEQFTDTKTLLLCTFTSKRNLFQTLDQITRAFNIDRNRVFVLKDVKSENMDNERYILTYNIVVNLKNVDVPFHKKISNTIKINRNKLNNCLYTLDALNAVIVAKTGKRDDSYEVNWEEYQNCLLTTNKEGELIVSKTEIESIQNVRGR